MKPLRSIGLYVLGVAVLGAVLAPWVFGAVQWLGTKSSLFHGLANQPFRRVFDHTVLVLALAGLWPLVKTLGIRSLPQVGFTRHPHAVRHLGLGLGLGVVSILLALALTRAPMQFDRTGPETARILLVFAVNAVAVALIEETIFRGVLQGALQRQVRFLFALALASAVYSVMHFIKPLGFEVAADQVTWRTGFSCLGYIGGRVAGKPDVAVAFVSLFLAGWVLGWAFARTGALYLSIGIHAGWVLAIQTARWLGAGNITEKPAVWPALVGLWAVVAWISRRPRPPGDGLAPAVDRPASAERGHHERVG